MPPSKPSLREPGFSRRLPPGWEPVPDDRGHLVDAEKDVSPSGVPERPESLWQAMQWVVTHPATADVTPLQKEARKWLQDERHEFLSKYADFEKAQPGEEEDGNEPHSPSCEETGEEIADERLPPIDELLSANRFLDPEALSQNGTNGIHLPSSVSHEQNGVSATAEPSVAAKPPAVALFCFPPPGEGRDVPKGSLESLLAVLSGREMPVHLFVPRAFPLATPGATIHVLGDCREGDLVAQAQEFGRRAAEAFSQRFDSTATPMLVMGWGWSAVPALEQIQKVREREVFLCLLAEEREDVDTTEDTDRQIEEIEVAGLQLARGILAWEPGIAEYAQELLPDCADRILPTPLLFPVADFQASIDTGAVRARFEVGPADPTVLYIGDLDERYGPDLLVKAMPAVLKQHPQARLFVVGYGEQFWPLRIFSRYRHLDNAVRLPGSIEGPPLRELIQAADLIAVPGRQAVSEWPALAAWAAHRPVIATREALAGLGIHDHDCLLVDPTPEALAWGIDELLGDPDRADILAENGHANVRNRVDWDALVTHLLTFSAPVRT